MVRKGLIAALVVAMVVLFASVTNAGQSVVVPQAVAQAIVDDIEPGHVIDGDRVVDFDLLHRHREQVVKHLNPERSLTELVLFLLLTTD